ncbi:MAG: PadR family transcriptional regulator [Kineosporiaceae bacterium]|nr:PadR family transcriptional regulator [Kineosporiaceae bacterium]MBK7622828.1 PadR family transcriptional regulator [Kineosporiaceae bacterium]MBK8078098.1 PadR family transcriptional regulator [Kineosporiaceae bacterium]
MDTTQLLKGVLDLAVLAVVSTEDGYGYDVVRRLRSAGLDDVGDASVYGTLRRLYSGGALTSYVVPSDEGPHRKYYGINPHGRALLAEQSQTWAGFAATMTGLLADAGHDIRDTRPLTTALGGSSESRATTTITSSREPVR